VKDGGCCVTCLLGINCGEQLLHGARRRCAEPLVEVDRLRKLLADEVIVPREFGVVRERLLNTIGVAAAQPPPPRSDRTTPVRRRGRRSVTHSVTPRLRPLAVRPRLLRRCALFATGGEPNEVAPTSGAM
jgi:hypothetical protein